MLLRDETSQIGEFDKIHYLYQACRKLLHLRVILGIHLPLEEDALPAGHCHLEVSSLHICVRLQIFRVQQSFQPTKVLDA